MAWNNVGGVVFLEARATIQWAYAWPGGADVGQQIADAYTAPHASPGALGIGIPFDQGKRVNGFSLATYLVKIRNDTPDFSRLAHNLQGGGVR